MAVGHADFIVLTNSQEISACQRGRAAYIVAVGQLF